MIDAPNIPLSVTDHALLRWLERIHGIDVGGFRDELRREAEAAVLGYGDDLEGDHAGTFVMDGSTVITVLGPGQRIMRAPWRSGVSIPRRIA